MAAPATGRAGGGPSSNDRSSDAVHGQIGTVAALWRYPVKSLGGEPVAECDVGERGIVGDRQWAVVGRDGTIGSGKTTRRFRRMPGLLSVSAATDDDGRVAVRLPDGRRLALDDPETAISISAIVGEPVTIAPEGAIVHVDDAPVHVLTTGMLDTLARVVGHTVDLRRFRPNIVFQSSEDGDRWVGRSVRVGSAVLSISKPTERCVMVTMEQPGVERLPSLLKAIGNARGGMVGQYASVVQPGSVVAGDAAMLC